jgi:leader peptidase (prepilin peptidase) / N-methyltransferase
LIDRGGSANTVNVLRLVVCALLALPVGWFAGVLIDRVPERESLTPLPGVRLSGKYLFVQLSMLVLFVLAALRFDNEPIGMLVGYLFLFAMLLTVSVIDVQLFRLPDLIVLPSIVISLVLVVAVSLIEDHAEWIRFALAGAGLYFGFLLLAHLVYPRGMGFGDVKLAAVMGLYVGWLGTSYTAAVGLVLWAMLIGFVAGSIIGMILLAIRRRSKQIPFGPFLALGAVVAVLLSSGLVTQG